MAKTSYIGVNPASISDANYLLYTYANRNYKKLNAGSAYCASIIVGTWLGPILVGRTPESVYYYTDGDYSFTNNGANTISVNGETWYVSTDAAWFQTTTNPGGNVIHLNAVTGVASYDSVASAAVALVEYASSLSGVARKIKKIYIGIDNVAREVKKAYIGVGGFAKQWLSTIYKWTKSRVKVTYAISDNVWEGHSIWTNQLSYDLSSGLGTGYFKVTGAYYNDAGKLVYEGSFNKFSSGPGYDFRYSTTPIVFYRYKQYSWDEDYIYVLVADPNSYTGSYELNVGYITADSDATTILFIYYSIATESAGTSLGTVTSENASAYPDNGKSGNYWYTKQ